MNEFSNELVKLLSIFGATRSEKVIHIGVDIGGSHIGFGAVDESGHLLTTTSCDIQGETLRESELLDLIATKSRSLLEELIHDDGHNPYVLGGIGIACPGQCKDGILVGASNLPLLRDIALASSVSKRFGGIDTVLLNDADAAIAAEVWGSSGVSNKLRTARNVAMITIGTGIGMGLIIDGKLYQGTHGLIEGGHMIVSVSTEGTRRCGCGQIGCAEAYASAKSTATRMMESDIQEKLESKNTMTSSSSSSPGRKSKAGCSINLDDFDVTEDPATLCDTPPDEENNISSNKDLADKKTSCKSDPLSNSSSKSISVGAGGGAKHVFQRSAAGDNRAKEVLELTAEVIAVLCINICRVVDPEYIIIGGGMSQAGNPLLSAIEYHFTRRKWTVLPDDVKLLLAKGAANAGILGAALAVQKQAQMSSTTNKSSREYEGSISATSSRILGGLLLASAVTSSVVLLSAMRNASKSSFFLKLFVGPSRSLAITSSVLITVNMGIGSWLVWRTSPGQ